jgi:hypothetical protein
VLCRDLLRGTVWPAKHDRDLDGARTHGVQLCGVADDLIEGDEGEVPGHELDNRAEPHHRGADADACEAGLGNGRVDYASLAEFLEEPFGYLIRALIVPDFLSHQEYAFVALHLLEHRLP